VKYGTWAEQITVLISWFTGPPTLILGKNERKKLFASKYLFRKFIFFFLIILMIFKLVSSVYTVIQVLFGCYFMQYCNKHSQISINKAIFYSLDLLLENWHHIIFQLFRYKFYFS
jgi:hypothetical protein